MVKLIVTVALAGLTAGCFNPVAPTCFDLSIQTGRQEQPCIDLASVTAKRASLPRGPVGNIDIP